MTLPLPARLILGAFAVPLLVTACAQAPQRPAAPTVKTLEAAPSIIVYEPRARIDKRRVIAAYEQVLTLPVDDELRRYVLRRIADLQLSLAEDARRRGEPVTALLAAALRRYEAYLQAFPDTEGDRILYELARAHQEAMLAEKALALLDRLTREYPHSPLRVEANFRRGELLFELRRFSAAIPAYEAVIARGPGSPLYTEALYKKGWSLFSLGRYEQGLDTFFTVLDRKLAPGGRFVREESPSVLDSRDHALVQDTLRVINMSFTYLEERRSITAYLNSRRQRPYDDLIYEALARRYLEKARYSDAAATYATFVNLNPGHPEAPYYQIKVYEVYEQAGFRSQAWAAKQDFTDRYGFESPFWKQYDIRRYPRVAEALKRNLMDLAQHYHALAQASGRQEDFAPVARMYRQFLGLFPGDPAAPRLRFLLAELLYETGRYREAIAEYEQTAYGYRRHDKAAAAGYAALAARYKLRPEIPAERRAAWEEAIVTSALQFTAHFPDHPETPTVLTRVAEDLFARKDYGRALELAQRLTRSSPPPEGALLRTAYTIQGHIFFDRSDFEAAARAYEQALAQGMEDDHQNIVIRERLAAALYRLGEAARAAGEPARAADYFLRIAPIAPPASPIAATALHDAAALLMSLGQWSRAIAALERFRNRYSPHSLDDEVTRKLAHAYLQAGRRARAADEFLRIGSSTDDAAQRREALWRAARLYDESDRPQDAAIAYQRYVTAFPTPLDPAQQARLRLAELNRALDNRYQHRHWLREIIAADQAAGTARTPYSHETAARASLALADALAEEFESIRLTVPLKESLAEKKRALDSAMAAYTTALDFGFADISTAATFALGRLYHRLSSDLLASQRPAGLSRLEREQYDILLEEEAYPFEEEAIRFHEANLHHLRDGIYDRWVKSSLEALAELLPARYDKQEKGAEYVAIIN